MSKQLNTQSYGKQSGKGHRLHQAEGTLRRNQLGFIQPDKGLAGDAGQQTF